MLDDKQSILNPLLNKHGSNSTQTAYNHLALLVSYIKKKIKKLAFSLKIFRACQFFRIKTILAYLFHDSDILVDLYSDNVTCVASEDEIKTVIDNYHMSPLRGHQVIILLERNGQGYYRLHSKMSKLSVEQSQRVNKVPMKITTTSSIVFERVFLDIVGALTVTTTNI